MGHPSKIALWARPRTVHRLLKKTMVFALLRWCQLDFRRFHFSKKSSLFNARKARIAVLRWCQLDFRVLHFRQNRCFLNALILEAGLYAKPLKQGSSSKRFEQFQFGSAQLSSVQFSSAQLSPVQVSSAQLSSAQFSLVQFSSVQFSSAQLNSI